MKGMTLRTQMGWVKLLGMATVVAVALMGVQALGQEVYTQPVGFYKIPINSTGTITPNFLSAPMHRIHDYRGIVASVTANTVTVSGSPWTVNQFAQAVLGSTTLFTNTQYICIVRKDASATPGVEGDWWPVISNTANTLTLDVGVEDLTTLLANPDQIEIRHLTSLKDLFGYQSSVILKPGSSGAFPNYSQQDVIRFLEGSSYSREIFYRTNANVSLEGYYIAGVTGGPYDGSQITLEPDQPLMLFRRPNGGATNIVSLGQVQVTRLTHYLNEGRNPQGASFPANAPINTSNLKESGWISGTSAAFPNYNNQDVLRRVVGSSYAEEVWHRTNTVASDWVVSGTVSNNYVFTPGTGYMFFLKTGGGALKWRQNAPY